MQLNQRRLSWLTIAGIFLAAILPFSSAGVIASSKNQAFDNNELRVDESTSQIFNPSTTNAISDTLSCNGTTVDFEGGLPPDWIPSAPIGPVVWSTTADLPACNQNSGSNHTNGLGRAACADSDETNNVLQGDYDAILETNSFDLTAVSSVTFTFLAAYVDNLEVDNFTVDVNTGTGWNNLLSWDEDHFPPGEQVTLDLSPFAGINDVKVRYRYMGDGWDWYVHVDDVSLACDCPVPIPTAPPDVDTAIAGSNINLSWSSTGDDHYEFWIGENDFYFVPGADCSMAANCSIEAANSASHSGGQGSTSTNHSYAIVSVNSCGHRSGMSNRTGEFDFAIVPGS